MSRIQSDDFNSEMLNSWSYLFSKLLPGINSVCCEDLFKEQQCALLAFFIFVKLSYISGHPGKNGFMFLDSSIIHALISEKFLSKNMKDQERIACHICSSNGFFF